MIRINSNHRQHLERQLMALNYGGPNKSKTLVGLVQDGYDAELV